MQKICNLEQEWMNTVTAFLEEYNFPKESWEPLTDDLNRVFACEDAWNIFCCYDAEYENTVQLDYQTLLGELEQSSELCKVHAYTLNLLFFIGLSRKTKQEYSKRGISLTVFHDSMMDLYYKLLECHKVYQIWGYAPGFWIDWWFEVRRFALGRLQFEACTFSYNYEKNGISLKPGDTVINVHIPSSGPLNREECQESYRLAAAFFKDIFPNGPVIFYCHSWLLFPPNREILPGTSRILEFMSDYDVFKTVYSNSELWRFFYREYNGHPEDLPQNNSLQRGYRNWLLSGNMAGEGYGIYVPFFEKE